MSATVSLLRSLYFETQCPITLDLIVDLPDPCRVMPCGHFFSKKELAAWQAIRAVCPLDLRPIEAIEAVQFVDSLEDATQESTVHQITTASKSNTVAATQFLQKAKKSNIPSLLSAPSVSSLEEVHLAVQNSDQNGVLEQLPLYLTGEEKMKQLRFFEKCMKISPDILSSVERLINVRSVKFQSVQHMEYSGPFINGAYGNGSFHTQWKVFLRNDGFQGFTLLAG